MNLVQFIDEDGARRVGIASQDGSSLQRLKGAERVYELALEAIRRCVPLAQLAQERLDESRADYQAVIAEKRLLPPIDHPDPAHCIVSGTGLTHLGSAQSRDEMHAKLEADTEPLSDSMKMFKLGLEGGKPAAGELGVQPEWFYKGDGQCVVPPEYPLEQPTFALDGGEEAEIAGLYLIAEDGEVWRVGYATGNEFADHVLEASNYLYLAHSKLRACSFGPELRLGSLPDQLSGTVRTLRQGQIVWQATLQSGEANMSHTLANLEHHHFKYPMFRRPGDVHVHFFGASVLSFSQGFKAQEGDLMEIQVPEFGQPLRNTLQVTKGHQAPIRVRSL